MAPRNAPSPQRAAMQRISEVLARGAGPDRMEREVEAIVVRLREQGDGDQVVEWLEELAEGFGANAEAAMEALDEIDAGQKAERRHAERAAQAMATCRDAFSRHARLPAAA